jgi:hypothetical protein
MALTTASLSAGPILFCIYLYCKLGTCHSFSVNTNYGCYIAQAVSCRLPTVAIRVRAHVRSCGICGGQSGTVVGFLRVLRCPLLHTHKKHAEFQVA